MNSDCLLKSNYASRPLCAKLSHLERNSIRCVVPPLLVSGTSHQAFARPTAKSPIRPGRDTPTYRPFCSSRSPSIFVSVESEARAPAGPGAHSATSRQVSKSWPQRWVLISAVPVACPAQPGTCSPEALHSGRSQCFTLLFIRTKRNSPPLSHSLASHRRLRL